MSTNIRRKGNGVIIVESHEERVGPKIVALRNDFPHADFCGVWL